jgi:hypothetical protein
MSNTAAQRTYRTIVYVLTTIMFITGAMAILVWALARPRPTGVPGTPTSGPAGRPTPTAIPTLAGTSDELLVCQREMGRALYARQMVGAANLADDGQLYLRWVSESRAINTLQDARSGVLKGLDAALEVRRGECAVFDRVTIDVYDRREDRQVHRLTVQAGVDDLVRWQAGDLGDRELLARLATVQVTPRR